MNTLNPKKRVSLATKFNLLTIALILVTSVGISLFVIRSEITNYYNELLNHGQSLADMTSKNCEYGIYTEDRESLLHVVESLSVNSDIAYVSVMNQEERQLVSKAFKQSVQIPIAPFKNIKNTSQIVHQDFINKKDGQSYIEILVPVVSIPSSDIMDPFLKADTVTQKSKVIGHIRIGLTQESLKKRIHQLLLSTALFTTLLVLLGSGLTILMTKKITSPLKKLKIATHDISEGNFDSRIDINTKDEISDLAQAFVHMLDHLRAYRTQVEERTSELTSTNQQLRQEIAARKLAEEQLLHDAFHDALTGLPNRALFMDRLAHTIAIAKRREDYFFAVLFLDLDRFKVINDSLGHIIGDQLLIELGKRLLACLRPGDTIARLGGDEFVILLDDIRDVRNTTRVVKRIENEMILPCNVAGHEIFATASIGIALSSTGYDLPEHILRDADTAMYRAKAQGRANYVVFESSMHIHAVERLQLDTDLRKAVERKEFVVYYQPIVSMETNSIIGFEALARWKHPERGILNPADFIPIAEETGLIVSIDRLVLREACKQMHEWQVQFPESSLTFISVNLSNKQLSQPDIVEYVSRILKETGLDPGSLKLEITENVIIENPEFTSAMLSQLKALGVLIYIDDFGTGYSSLSYLHRLPIDGLKIDRSFIRRMGDKGENQEIIKTILLLAKDLNVTAIAEGIETGNQLTQIKSLNCEYWQGYLFSKPVESEQAKALIELSQL